MKVVLDRRDQADKAVVTIIERTGARQPDEANSLNDRELKLPSDAAAIDLSAIESGVVCLFVEQSRSLRVLHIPWERSQRSGWRSRWSAAWKAEVQRLGLNRSDLTAPTLPLDEELHVDAGGGPTLEGYTTNSIETSCAHWSMPLAEVSSA